MKFFLVTIIAITSMITINGIIIIAINTPLI